MVHHWTTLDVLAWVFGTRDLGFTGHIYWFTFQHLWFTVLGIELDIESISLLADGSGFRVIVVGLVTWDVM